VVIASYAILLALLVRGCVRLGCLDAGLDTVSTGFAAAWSLPMVLAFPAIVEGTSLGLIETAVASHFAAGMLAILAARRSPAAGSAGWALAALAAGGAAGCKYPAVVLVIPPLIGFWFWAFGSKMAEVARRPGFGRCLLRFFALAIAMGAAGGGIWYLKNWIVAGNPVYPLAANFLGGRTMTPEKIAQWNAGHATLPITAQAFFGSAADLLWRWRLQGWLLVPLVLAMAIGGKRFDRSSFGLPWILMAMAAYAWAAWWLATHRVDRFLIPVLPIAMLAAGIGIGRLRQAAGARFTTIAVLVLAGLNLVYVSGPALGDARILVSLDYLRRDDLSGSAVTRLPAMVRWVNANISPDARVLVLGDAAVFDYQPSTASSTTFDESPLIDIIEDVPVDQWRKRFAATDYDYLAIDWQEIKRLRSTYGFDQRISRDLIQSLVDAGAIGLIHVEDQPDGFEIYRFAELQPAEGDQAVTDN
jgi:hypothetical protein